MAEVLVFANNNGGRYIHDSLYESYIESKIDSEDILARALKEQMILKESDYSSITALHEASLGDKIKVKWKKFIAFIKGLIARFMESMTNILYDERGYLEKYKDIILQKKPKTDLEFSYTGNYEEGIKRITNTTVPLFEYQKYKNAFDAEDDGDLANAIMQGKQFKYTDGETLDEQFKEYYLVTDDGVKTGKLSDIRMVDLYNFCYNFSKIKGITDKDLGRLDASTKNIEREIVSRMNSTTNQTTDQTVNSTATSTTDGGSTNDNQSASNQNESAIFLEDSENDKKDKPQGLQITSTDNNQQKGSTDFTKNASSTDQRNKDQEKAAADRSGNAEVNEIQKAADKWIRVCRSLIAAKCTACQQIAKDYMSIIRAHVRSYGGKDDNAADNKSKDKGTEYKKENPDAKKAEEEAKQAQNDADTTENKINNTVEKAKSAGKSLGKRVGTAVNAAKDAFKKK